uniref:Carbohydrate kinase PfkB domain-containing protein n=1 Tax=Hanusia phi TaxID=3032 RepID=A0A6T7MSJ2_9CRYP
MSSLFSKYSPQVGHQGENWYGKDPNELPPVLREVMEQSGMLKDGRWLTEEEMAVEYKKSNPDWEPAAWPLGSPDVGRMSAADFLANPEVGGEPDLWPLGVPRVLCIGEMLVDCIAESAEVKMGDPADKWTKFAGGAPANVACALAKLGTPAGFIGTLGDDEDGETLRRTLEECKLPLCLIQTAKGKPTRKVFVTRNEQGDRKFEGFELGAVDNYADCYLKESDLDGTWFYASEYMVTGTLSLAYEETRKTLMTLKGFCEMLNIVRFVDVNWRPMFWKQNEETAKQIILDYIQGAQIVKMTEEEASWLLGVSREKVRNKPSLILKLLPSCVCVLVTAGEEGASYAFHKHGGRLPAFEVPVVDTTGAGDAFSAGFLHKLLELTDAWQEEFVDMNMDRPLPRPHFIPSVRIAKACEDKNLAADAVLYGAAVGAMTCMEEGAIKAQPSGRLANKFFEVYSEAIEIEEEERDFQLPDFGSGLKWTYSP